MLLPRRWRRPGPPRLDVNANGAVETRSWNSKSHCAPFKTFPPSGVPSLIFLTSCWRNSAL
eukprot:11219156-Lingulodinium_polyedra.AAC.1